MEEYVNLIQTLNRIGTDVRVKYKQQLKSHNKIASGKLYNSIDYKLVITETNIRLYFLAQDYWIYVENGRKAGKMPPISAIKGWMVKKGIADINGASYKISRSIGKNGIRPSPYLRNIKETLVNDYTDDIMAAFNKDVELQLNKIIENK